MSERGETEPLLGRPGDALQDENQPIYHNLILGMFSLSPFLHY